VLPIALEADVALLLAPPADAVLLFAPPVDAALLFAPPVDAALLFEPPVDAPLLLELPRFRDMLEHASVLPTTIVARARARPSPRAVSCPVAQ